MRMVTNGSGRHWNPFQEFNQLQQEMQRLFGGLRTNHPAPVHEYPAVNLFASQDGVVLTAELPGVDPEKLEITVAGDTCTIQGERPIEELKANESFHRQERTAGKFTRTLQLPFEVDTSKTEASYEKGVLTVKMARPEEQKPKKITVKPS